MEENKDLEEANEQLLKAHHKVMKLMGWTAEKTWEWIGASNPAFGYASPVEMVISGKSEKLMSFIAMAEEDMIQNHPTEGKVL